MPRITVQGKARYIARSVYTLYKTSIQALLRRLFGKPLEPTWSLEFEIGMLFLRDQMRYACSLPDIKEARAYFDSLQVRTATKLPVARGTTISDPVRGQWYLPQEMKSATTVYYLHGGGYAYYAKTHDQMIESVAYALGSRTFALDYRLTPEHPHPAQLEDALAGYRYLLSLGTDARSIVVAGDSAGGHLALMLLLALRDEGLPQPALAIGICPWTDIGRRGNSLFENDRYDWVQGEMALRFGEWLIGDTGLTKEQVSPINQNFAGLAPIYLQGGGKEILIDMIRDFATVARNQGAEVLLDVWEQMTHDFQGYGVDLAESREALRRMAEVVEHYVFERAASKVRPTKPHLIHAPV